MNQRVWGVRVGGGGHVARSRDLGGKMHVMLLDQVSVYFIPSSVVTIHLIHTVVRCKLVYVG